MLKPINLKVPVKDGSLPVFCLSPVEAGPLLVVVPSIFGIGPDVVAFANRFRDAGALVYVLDSFWRTSPGPLPIPGGAKKALSRRQDLSHEDALHDLLAAVEHGLQDGQCNGSSLLLGICFGGKFAVHASQFVAVNGIVVWHGASILPFMNPEKMRGCHIRMEFGGADPLIPLTEVRKIEQELHGLENIGVFVHPNAGHGFTHLNTSKCNPMAAEFAENRVLELISIFG